MTEIIVKSEIPSTDIALDEVPDDTWFTGTINGDTGLFFRSNDRVFDLSDGGDYWLLEDAFQVKNYRPIKRVAITIEA